MRIDERLSGVQPSYEMPSMPTRPLLLGMLWISQSIVSKASVLSSETFAVR